MSLANVPTLTVMRHSQTKTRTKAEMKQVTGKGARLHDPSIIDHDSPKEAAQTLLLDLGLTAENIQSHRILIVCSPFARCIETAVAVAQTIDVCGIQVHYGMTERISKIRDSEWDFECVPLYMTESEMRQCAVTYSKQDERFGKCRVEIEEFVGKKMGNDDINEMQDMCLDRVGFALEDIRLAVQGPGDHAIAVGHFDTIEGLANKYGPKGVQVLDAKPCSFVTVNTISANCFWLSGRSRVRLNME